MAEQALSRGDRKDSIALAFQVNILAGRPNYLTMYDVARKLKLAPSTKLQNIMLEMVQDGTLTFEIKYRADSRWKRIFSLSKTHSKFPKSEPRTIKLNGQLELWK